MLYKEREDYILEKLETESIIKINDLVHEMGVSIDTIRRDLRQLEKLGRLTCIRGGACLPKDTLQYSPFFGRQIINEQEKYEIAKKAVSMIHSGNIIAMNAGTTNAILAKELVKLNKKFTVVTNNLSAISILMSSNCIQLIIPGGIVDKKEESLYSNNCLQEISSYSFDICFLSINAYNTDDGFSDFRFQEIDVINAMIKHSKQTVAVMDSHKLGMLSKKLFLPATGIDVLVTDHNVESHMLSKIKEKGITVI